METLVKIIATSNNSDYVTKKFNETLMTARELGLGNPEIIASSNVVILEFNIADIDNARLTKLRDFKEFFCVDYLPWESI